MSNKVRPHQTTRILNFCGVLVWCFITGSYHSSSLWTWPAQSTNWCSFSATFYVIALWLIVFLGVFLVLVPTNSPWNNHLTLSTALASLIQDFGISFYQYPKKREECSVYMTFMPNLCTIIWTTWKCQLALKHPYSLHRHWW